MCGGEREESPDIKLLAVFASLCNGVKFSTDISWPFSKIRLPQKMFVSKKLARYPCLFSHIML